MYNRLLLLLLYAGSTRMYKRLYVYAGSTFSLEYGLGANLFPLCNEWLKYIDLVSPNTRVLLCVGPSASDSHLDLGRAPYVLYGVKYIDTVSLCAVGPSVGTRSRRTASVSCLPVTHTLTWVVRPMVCMVLNILAQYPLRRCRARQHAIAS